MDLFDLMTEGADPEALILDRLDGIVALYDSADEAVQDEALARAITLCGKQWGGYAAGMEALARRVEGQGSDCVESGLRALRLREEGEDPGVLIRLARARRAVSGRDGGERAALIARHGSLEAALAPTPVEQLFIDAARPLGQGDDPWGALAGWSVPWHDVPGALRDAVSTACPLPATITDARDEALSWQARLRDLAVLSDGPGAAALPTACAARHKLVEDLWRRDLPVRHAAELEARLDYWAVHGGDDGLGYGVLLADVRQLRAVADGGLAAAPGDGASRQRVLRLKAEHPDWSLARIGAELGISRQAVHKHLKKGGGTRI